MSVLIFKYEAYFIFSLVYSILILRSLSSNYILIRRIYFHLFSNKHLFLIIHIYLFLFLLLFLIFIQHLEECQLSCICCKIHLITGM